MIAEKIESTLRMSDTDRRRGPAVVFSHGYSICTFSVIFPPG